MATKFVQKDVSAEVVAENDEGEAQAEEDKPVVIETLEGLKAKIPYDEEFEELDLNFDIKDIAMAMRKKMGDNDNRMILRVSVCFKDIGQFTGKTKDFIYGPNYSGNHLAIFECELK